MMTEEQEVEKMSREIHEATLVPGTRVRIVNCVGHGDRGIVGERRGDCFQFLTERGTLAWLLESRHLEVIS